MNLDLFIDKDLNILYLHIQFLREQKPGYTTNLIRNRVLPLYKSSTCHPYLVASANWVLGEFAPCIPEVSIAFATSFSHCFKYMSWIYISSCIQACVDLVSSIVPVNCYIWHLGRKKRQKNGE